MITYRQYDQMLVSPHPQGGFMKTALFVLLSLASQTTMAQELLAQKGGTFSKFNRCSIFENRVELQINLQNGKMIESTKLANSQNIISKLSDAAITSAARATYRWLTMQHDYHVRGSDGNLAKFYAFGFETISNNSTEALALIEYIDQVCDQHAEDFKLLGEFQVDLKIGDRVFADQLIVERDSPTDSMARVRGKYIVPNSFESKIKEVNYRDGVFSFQIEVKEGSDEYDALFEGEISSNGELSGAAFVLPARSILGTFTGKRIVK